MKIQLNKSIIISYLLLCLASGISSSAEAPYFKFFEGKEVTDVSLASTLNDAPGLRRIKFQEVPGITDKGFAMLSGLADLEFAEFFKVNMSGSVLKTLAELPRLQEISIVASKFDEEKLKHLASSNLKKIILTESTVGNIGAYYLSFIPGLELINLSTSKIDDRAMPYLSKLPKLRFLYLSRTELSDKAAADLAKLNSLEFLDIRQTRIGDPGLAKISGLPKLKTLLVSEITSLKGVEFLKECKTLKSLTLNDANINDAIVDIVASMPNLSSITFYRTKITEGAIDSLKKKRPELKIFGPEPDKIR